MATKGQIELIEKLMAENGYESWYRLGRAHDYSCRRAYDLPVGLSIPAASALIGVLIAEKRDAIANVRER